MTSLCSDLARWCTDLSSSQIPEDVRRAARLRLLDTMGLMLAAGSTDFGRSVTAAAQAWGGAGPCRIIGARDPHAVGGSLAAAAVANGGLSHATLFDDTHVATFIHVSGAVLAGLLAVCEVEPVSGEAFLAAFVAGSETTCRIGLIAPGQMHIAGFHATGVVGAFGAAAAVSRALRLDWRQTAHALGIVGSMASGINQSWADGALAQTLHPGWAANAGVAAALMARHGITGPAEVLEGRFGVMRSHVHDAGYAFDFDRATRSLGDVWESRDISMKPYPCAHFLHAFLDALFELRHQGLRAEQVDRIVCPIASYMVPIVCEPRAEKLAPTADWMGRTSLQFSLAEALVTGRLDHLSYGEAARRDPQILALASRVEYAIDPDAPPKGRFKGHVRVETRDGRRLEQEQAFNRGSVENPMKESEVIDKFLRHAAMALPAERCTRLVKGVDQIEQLPLARQLLDICSTPEGR